jgi:drug/metabolite transporter (DMT)-like permease
MSQNTARTPLSLPTLAKLGMVLCVLIYGANFVISRYAVLNGLTPHDLLAMRFAVAGTLLLPIFLKAGGFRDCAGAGWKHGLILAVMSGIPMSYLMLTGLSLAPAAHGASIGPGTVTLIGIIGSVAFFGAVLTRNLVVGVISVICGLALLAIAGTTSASSTVVWGDLCFLGVGLLWGGYPLVIQLWKVDGLRATAIVSVVSMIYLPIYALFFFRGFDIAPWWLLLAHAFNQGVVNIIIGLWIWGWAAHVLGSERVGRFPPMIPVTGTLLAIPILGEIPGPLQWSGIALIVGGLFIAAWKKPVAA